MKVRDYFLIALAGILVTGQLNAAKIISSFPSLTPNRLVIASSNGYPISSTVTSIEAGYLGGVTSAIQTQLNTKLTSPFTTKGDIVVYDGSAAQRLAVGSTANMVLSVDSTQSLGVRWSTPTASAVALGVTSKTGNYTLTSGDDLVLASASGGTFTLTLPTAVGITGKVYYLKKTDSTFTEVSIATTSAQTINGAASSSLNTQNETLTVVSDGSNWQILNRKTATQFTAYTPTFGTTYGTVTNINVFWRRIGDSIEIHGAAQAGTIAGGNGTITLPTGLVIDLTKVRNATAANESTIVGYMTRGGGVTQNTVMLVNNNTLADVMCIGSVTDGTGTEFSSASTSFTNNGTFSWYVKIPISGWKD